MEHQMKLNERPFELVKSGKKNIEIRLFDEKRQRLKIGDTIIFSKLQELKEMVSVKITGLLHYAIFQELVNALPMSDFGYQEDYNKDDFVNSIYTIYSKEEEQKYGVLGIRIKLL